MIQYAFELLTNPLWKRNYDIFGIDEHIHSASFDPGDHDFEVITSRNFLSKFKNSKALLIQDAIGCLVSITDSLVTTSIFISSLERFQLINDLGEFGKQWSYISASVDQEQGNITPSEKGTKRY
ncbi:unnamed protein product [Camellia sinensis]